MEYYTRQPNRPQQKLIGLLLEQRLTKEQDLLDCFNIMGIKSNQCYATQINFYITNLLEKNTYLKKRYKVLSHECFSLRENISYKFNKFESNLQELNKYINRIIVLVERQVTMDYNVDVLEFVDTNNQVKCEFNNFLNAKPPQWELIQDEVTL